MPTERSASVRVSPRLILNHFPSRTALLCALVLLGGGCSNNRGTTTPPLYPTPRPVLGAAYRASGRAAAGDVFVHLFEWKWTDIAAECESVLGPNEIGRAHV